MTNFLLVILIASKHDQAGALLLACTIDIFKNKIIAIKAKELNNIKIGFLLCTGNLINLTFFLLIYLINSPPLVSIVTFLQDS